MPKLSTLLDDLQRHVGVIMYSQQHLSIIDAYNNIKPLPVGYQMSYSDDWCDAFVTYMADRHGLADQIGRECGVERHRRIMEAKGLYMGKVNPRPGDIIFFDWNSDGFCDHIGFVVEVGSGQVTTIEGNSLRQIRRNKYDQNAIFIKGYARPKYSQNKSLDQIHRVALEVIRGLWDNGKVRVEKLRKAGYDPVAVQKRVNQLLL